MGILKQAITPPIRKVFNPGENLDLGQYVGWRTLGGSSAYGFYKDNQYENGYSSIRVLAEAFMVIEPYTIDKNSNVVASNLLDRLYTPNTDMSAADFREALMVCTLVHDKVRLRVHHTGTRINADSIIGFTFMEDFSETIVGGIRHYKMSNGEDLTDETVITLKSVNPDSVTNGFSPSRAARRWTKLDDYIADYQSGFFENGAIPQGQLIITARTATEYNDIVDVLQRRHKGAGKNNNVTYSHRPTDQNGSPLNSQIEWQPFSTQNKDMALKDLFTQVNQKIDSTYGVPASLRAVNDTNTYASIRVDEVVLVKYGLAPKTMKIWNKFTHELNRITGGAGVAISYDLEIPKLADEEKVKAEAKSVDATTVSTLTTQGFELKSAVEYVQSGDLEVLVLGKIPPKDEPDILTSEEAKDTPEQPIDAFAKGFIKLQKYFDKTKTKAIVKQISPQVRREYETQLAAVVRRQDERQINRAVEQVGQKSKAIGDVNEEEVEQFSSEMAAVLLPLVVLEGITQRDQGVQLILEAGLNVSNISAFQLTPEQRATYKAYLKRVGVSHTTVTSQYIRDTLDQALVNSWTAQEIKDKLSQYLAEEWRIDRIVVTEVNKAGTTGSVNSMVNIADETGYKINKIWTHSGMDAPCPFCASLIGTSVPVDKNYIDLNQQILGTDGSVFHNDFEAKDSGGLHPACHCSSTYKVEEN